MWRQRLAIVATTLLVATACSGGEPPATDEFGGLRVLRFTEGDASIPELADIIGTLDIDPDTGCLLFGTDEFSQPRVLAIPRGIEISVEGDGTLVGDFGRIPTGDTLFLAAAEPETIEEPTACDEGATPVFWSTAASWDDPFNALSS
ncbi:MAG: hypothetical protein AAGC53_17460 [Actinomycetota bacterium]